MGCDIHGCVQRRSDVDYNVWETFAEGWADRHYALFTIIAGVRKYGDRELFKTISTPRGLPKDLTVSADGWDQLPAPPDWEQFQWLDDSWRKPDTTWVCSLGDHSQSYLTGADLLAFDWSAVPVTLAALRELEIIESVNSYHLNHTYAQIVGEPFMKWMMPWATRYRENARWVFGFDS